MALISVKPEATQAQSMVSLPQESSMSILLNQNNDFVGTCAIITDDSTNNKNQLNRKALTAAHKLKSIATNDLLEARWELESGIHLDSIPMSNK